ncbi:MAG: hypothetical protein ACRYFZ_01600 [Janthinobacterium lividum]
MAYLGEDKIAAYKDCVAGIEKANQKQLEKACGEFEPGLLKRGARIIDTDIDLADPVERWRLEQHWHYGVPDAIRQQCVDCFTRIFHT